MESLGSCPVRVTLLKHSSRQRKWPPLLDHFGSLLGLIRWGGVGRRKGSGAMIIQDYVSGKCLARAYLGI